MSDTTAPPQGPADSTTARVAEVLLAFAGEGGPLGVTDIARNTGLSKAVVHRIVQTLCGSELVWQHPKTRKYQLGVAAFALADSAAQTSRFRKYGAQILADLAEKSGETTTLSGRVGHRRVYIAQVESSQLIRISVQVGIAHPLTVGASGAAILAFLPEREIEAALQLAEHLPGEGARSREQQLERLREVRERGFARTTGERVKDSTSIAAPVMNTAGEALGAISIAALTSRVTPEREQELAEQVMQAAATLTERLRE